MRNLKHAGLAAFAFLLLVVTNAIFPTATVANNFREAAEETTTPAARYDHGLVREKTIDGIVKQHPEAELIFIGDSITQGWEFESPRFGRNVWTKYYGKRRALNLGSRGDRTQNVLWRLDHGNLERLHAKLAVVMIGTNNSGANTPDEVRDGVGAIVTKLRARMPGCKVLVLAIFPRGRSADDRLRKLNEAANQKIEKLADGEHVFYLDIGAKFLGPNGTLSAQVMPDFLHPNENGYRIWASAIEPEVARLLGESR